MVSEEERAAFDEYRAVFTRIDRHYDGTAVLSDVDMAAALAEVRETSATSTEAAQRAMVRERRGG